jgi:hypothetical protein
VGAGFYPAEASGVGVAAAFVSLRRSLSWLKTLVPADKSETVELPLPLFLVGGSTMSAVVKWIAGIVGSVLVAVISAMLIAHLKPGPQGNIMHQREIRR